MMRISQIVPLIACLVSAGFGQEAEAGGQFDSIAARNVFGLDALSAPLLVAKPPAIPKVLPDLTVTGLTDICGRNQVLVEMRGGGQPVLRLILQEGTPVAGLEVLGIDLERDSVRVLVLGEEMELRLAPAFRTSRETTVVR